METRVSLKYFVDGCSLAIKKIDKIKPTPIFFRGKMLIFTKVLLERFVYDLTETFSFPNAQTKGIYNYYMIERIFPYSILTDTSSICTFFIFICKPESCAPDSVFRYVLFELIIKNDVLHRFDTSHKFWEKYGIRNKHLKKKLGYISIGNIDDPCVVTVAVNPKKYFEEFESQSVNKNIRD